MENFTIHRASMAMQDYSFVTFKEVEQQINRAPVVVDGVPVAYVSPSNGVHQDTEDNDDDDADADE